MTTSDDKRVDIIEEELKLLKGEVKRTLVDLRAFVMREDSPLNERMDMSSSGTTERIITKEQVVMDDSRVRELEEQLREMRMDKVEAQVAAVPQQLAPPPPPPPPRLPRLRSSQPVQCTYPYPNSPLRPLPHRNHHLPLRRGFRPLCLHPRPLLSRLPRTAF